MRKFVVLVAVVLLAGCQGPKASDVTAQPNQALAAATPDEAAQKALAEFRGLVTDENAASLGFASAKDVERAQLGQPLTVRLVPLDRLQSYQAGADPAALLVDANRVIYPIRVDDIVRSSLDVGRVGDTWEGQSFGSPELIRALEALKPQAGDGVVWVPALNVYFLGRTSDTGLVLTPAFDRPEMELAAGRPMPAGNAFAAMVPLAKEQTGLPN